MAAVSPTFEANHYVGQPAGAFGQIRRINLRDITQADDLGAGAGTRYQRLDLLGRQILGFVDDQILADEGASAHEIERFDFDT